MSGLALLTAAVFALVTCGTLVALLFPGSRHGLALQRLSPPGKTDRTGPPAPVLNWRELVAELGAMLPVSARTRPRVQRLLMRAGFRGRNADRYFQGTRVVCMGLFAAGTLIAGLRYSAFENWPVAAIAAAAVGYMIPGQYLLLRASRRQRAIARGLPNALDLMVVCVEAGLGIDQTTLQVSKELQTAYPEICAEFALMNLELRAGKPRADALHHLAERTGVEDIRKLVAVLVQTDRFGTSIGQCLREHADYMRTMARQRAEAQASKLAVKLVFPIFFCVLPSLFVVTVGPVITHLIRDLVPMIENM